MSETYDIDTLTLFDLAGSSDATNYPSTPASEELLQRLREAPTENIDDGSIILPNVLPAQLMKYGGSSSAILGTGAYSSVVIALVTAGGHNQITVYADPEHRSQFDAMKAKGKVATGGLVTGNFRVTFCDTFEEAVLDREWIFFTTPIGAVYENLTRVKKLLDDPRTSSRVKCTHFFFQPPMLSTISARLIFGQDSNIVSIEVSSATITAKWEPIQRTTLIKKMKTSLEFSVLGGALTEAEALMRSIFPNPLLTRQDPIELFFNAPGAMVHQLACLAGLDVIQKRDGDPNARFYRDVVGLEATEALIEQYDAARQKIARRLRFQSLTFLQCVNKYYPHPDPGERWTRVIDWARYPGPHNAQSAMPRFDGLATHRFMTEDGRASCYHERFAKLCGMDPGDYGVITEVINRISEKIVGHDMRLDAAYQEVGLDCDTIGDYYNRLDMREDGSALL
jgi:hypothetical protein